MLCEIVCDKFKNNRVSFHEGLNVVLGDNEGSNSIGKSTFLMIIDFVFGGKDYMMLSTDIQRNVGRHTIKYCFKFDQKTYWFSRDTANIESVNVCDSDYSIIDTMTLDAYCIFLKQQYDILVPEIGFRNIIGRFSRVYGKENLDEKRPLHIVKNEKSNDAINALLKLFDLYAAISELELSLKEKDSELSSYKSAQKYNFIHSIGKSTYNANKKELLTLSQEQEKFAQDLDNNLLDLNSVIADELIRLKNDLSLAKRYRSRIIAQLKMIEINLDETRTFKNTKFEELTRFFPNTSLQEIDKVEQFHKEIRQALKSEMNEKRVEFNKLLEISNARIDDIEKNIDKTSNGSSLSKVVLSKYSAAQKKIEELRNENESFDILQSLIQAKKDAKDRRDLMRFEQLQRLESTINGKMQSINDYIYSGTKKPPILNLEGNKYDFTTMDDTGTGISYKSLIVYDISILMLTELPILIHDSVVLKQISDIAIEKILELYMKVNKQIFISFDKISAYTKKSQSYLQKSKVLELSVGGNELFGRSWNER